MNWKRTLRVLWTANFIFATGVSLILPFLPLYIQQLGVHDTSSVVKWSGWVFTAQSVTAFIFQPYWGSLADKHGHRGMLLKSGIGIAVMTILMGFANAPWQLLALRLINGVFSGFIAMSTSFQAAVTPKEHVGKALGGLQTGQMAGILIGPLFGGGLAELIGFRNVFILTGILSLLATLCVGFFVKKEPVQEKAKTVEETTPINGWKEMFPIIPVFIAMMVTQLGMMSIQPIITIYTQKIYSGSHLELMAGLVVAMTGIGNLIGSPILGRLGDKIGPRKILIISMVFAGITFLPQALSSSILILLISRFLLGLFVGGMMPSLNILVKDMAPQEMVSRAFGISASSRYLGNLSGPLLGSTIAAVFDFHYVFYTTMCIFLINAVFIFLNKGMGTKRKNHNSSVITNS